MPSNSELQGRIAIVTGSARRIGRAIAMGLAERGAAVLINSRSDQNAARSTAEEIVAKGGRAIYCVADVTNKSDVDRMVAKAAAEFGGIDILVNNAATRPNAPLEEITLDEWKEVVGVVLDGAFLCSQACAPFLRKSAHGRIINIGGTGAHIAVKNRIHVMAGKSGLVGLTKGLALELAPVTANVVVPGMIVDEQDNPAEAEARRKRMPVLPMVGRTGKPDDIAGMVAFLCSDAGSYITAQTLHVSGGLFTP